MTLRIASTLEAEAVTRTRYPGRLIQMPHECITQKDRDVFAYVEQYNVRCRCHMDSWRLWRPGDVIVQCPVSGVDLTAGVADGEALGSGGA
jgi:hypothetical protein